MSSSANYMSVYTVVAKNSHQGSCKGRATRPQVGESKLGDRGWTRKEHGLAFLPHGVSKDT